MSLFIFVRLWHLVHSLMADRLIVGFNLRRSKMYWWLQGRIRGGHSPPPNCCNILLEVMRSGKAVYLDVLAPTLRASSVVRFVVTGSNPFNSSFSNFCFPWVLLPNFGASYSGSVQLHFLLLSLVHLAFFFGVLSTHSHFFILLLQLYHFQLVNIFHFDIRFSLLFSIP